MLVDLSAASAVLARVCRAPINHALKRQTEHRNTLCRLVKKHDRTDEGLFVAYLTTRPRKSERTHTLEVASLQILARASVETAVDVTGLDPVLAVGSRKVVETGARERVDAVVTGASVETGAERMEGKQ